MKLVLAKNEDQPLQVLEVTWVYDWDLNNQ
jgi:hypothetical protein